MFFKKSLESYVKSSELNKVIRGEKLAYKTPANINALLLPTDHSVLLKELDKVSNKTSAKLIKNSLEKGILDAATDALGVYCALQCYYAQIVKEDYQSNFEIDRIALPLKLGKKYLAFEQNLKTEKKPYGEIGRIFKLCNACLLILNDEYQIEFGVTLD